MENPMVRFEIEMTPEEYVELRKDADWYGKSVGQYLVAKALGQIPRGC